jgi:anaerobic magnesium-protoporphyrin IX monomethyl ester cyclase
MKDLFLFVRPPRPLWPFNGPASSVWPPLAFATLAAALRASVPDLSLAILDAPALHMGWQSLENEMRRLQPAFVAIGEEAVSCTEGLRLARLAKSLHARVIAGGCFFSHVAEEVLATGLIDAVVHGEGEVTIVALLEALRSGSARELHNVLGISFADAGGIIRTGPRPLIPDLDTLPMPAYDLLPVACYGRGSRNHPDLAAIELGRGCVGSCAFCVLWRQMGQYRGTTIQPQLRTKSPERLHEEIRILTGKFHRRYLGWVDPCFNADSKVPAQMADLMLRDNLHVGQSAWVRADGIVRDASSGALARCVRSGLNEVYLGIERSDAATLHGLNKTVDPNSSRHALQILADNFPEVFTVGSFIYGLPEDTPDTVRDLRRYAWRLSLDYPFFIPLTPLPGTPYWQSELWDATGKNFRSFGFLPGALQGDDRSALNKAILISDIFDWNRIRFHSDVRGIFHHDPRKRRLTRRLMWRGGSYQVRQLFKTVLGKPHDGGMLFPTWYES